MKIISIEPRVNVTMLLGLLILPNCWSSPQDISAIGRDPSCGVWLDQPGVSRHHARVVVTDDVAEIEDLGSTNGTIVNGVRVQEMMLRQGDTVRIGSTTFRLEQ